MVLRDFSLRRERRVPPHLLRAVHSISALLQQQPIRSLLQQRKRGGVDRSSVDATA
jgi:hypothetical protein